MSILRNVCLLAAAFVVSLTMAGAAQAETTMTLQQAKSLFLQGKAAYTIQKYEQAADDWKRVVENGYESPEVLYNLGTAEARLGHKGAAIGYLTRAQRLDPRNEDISLNLQRIKQQGTDEKKPTAEGTSASSVWHRIIMFLSASEWLALLWAAVMLCCAGAALLMIGRSARVRRAAQVTISLGAAVLVLCGIPAIAAIYQARIVQTAIAVRPAEVLSGPGERFTSIATLTEGEAVEDLESVVEGYQQVKLPNQMTGYVEQNAIMPL